MSRQYSLQRCSSLVLLATLVSLVLFYTLPAILFHAGRAWEMGRITGAAEKADQADEAARREEREQIDSVRRASERVLPAVVRIEALHESLPGSDGADFILHEQEPAHRTKRICGLVIGQDGQVLTNYAAVAGAREIRVHLSRHSDVRFARFIAGDPDTDLAILRIEPPATDLKVVQLNEHELPRIGERVIAIGSADQADHALWVGTVHAEGRNTPPAGCLPRDFIQATPVNPRNAGGPLLNARGEVVGINSTFAGDAGDQPVGIVVPAEIAVRVVALLREQGRVERGWLGVFLHRVDRTMHSEDSSTAFALDYVVPESPASKAGLHAGDWITRVCGRTFSQTSELRRWIAIASPTTELVVTFIRNDQQIERKVVVEPRPDSPPLLPGEAEWGIRVLCHTPSEERRQAGLHDEEGVVIQEVSAAAQTAKLKPGDAIVEVNGTPTRGFDDFCREVRRWRESPPGDVARLTVQSHGTKWQVEIAQPDIALRSSSR